MEYYSIDPKMHRSRAAKSWRDHAVMGNKMGIEEENECRALQTPEVIPVICVILGLKLAVTTRKGLWQTFPKHPWSATVGAEVMSTWTFGITPYSTVIKKKSDFFFF